MAHPGGWIIRIPDRDKESLTRLFGLSSSDAGLLAAELRKGRPTVSVREFAAQINVPGVPSETVEGVVGVLVSLLATAEIRQRSAEELAAEVVKAARAQSILTNEESEDRLRSLLTADSALSVTAKAIAISSEHERVFTSARILTDLRPIFAGTPPQPKAAVVTHTLRIESHKEEGHTSEFFGLDVGDLRTLRDTIDRAISKEDSLRASIRSEGLPIIGSNHD